MEALAARCGDLDEISHLGDVTPPFMFKLLQSLGSSAARRCYLWVRMRLTFFAHSSNLVQVLLINLFSCFTHLP